MLTTKRELLYGGPMTRAKRYHYVTYFAGHVIASGPTLKESAALAKANLTDIVESHQSAVYASLCADGTIITTREIGRYLISQSYHRAETDGRGHGITVGGASIGGVSATVQQCHAHAVARYNDCTTSLLARQESSPCGVPNVA